MKTLVLLGGLFALIGFIIAVVFILSLVYNPDKYEEYSERQKIGRKIFLGVLCETIGVMLLLIAAMNLLSS